MKGAELLKARCTIARYKAIFGGDCPAGWGMGIVEAQQIVTSFLAARAASKALEEARKKAAAEARESKREEKAAAREEKKAEKAAAREAKKAEQMPVAGKKRARE